MKLTVQVNGVVELGVHEPVAGVMVIWLGFGFGGVSVTVCAGPEVIFTVAEKLTGGPALLIV